MELTGQPMVDVGYAIAALLQHKKSVSEVNQFDVLSAVKQLSEQIDPSGSNPGPLNKLKVLSAYWQNNPLAGHNMGSHGENVPRYRKVLEGIGGTAKKPGHCQICGGHGVYTDANRSWFPLGASSGGDPCSLPGLSGKLICATCFGAITLLPLGCKFVSNNPYLFHVDDPQLICDATEPGFRAIQVQIVAKQSGNAALKADATLTGRLGLLEVLSSSRLWDKNQEGILTKRASNGATIIAFSNSGTSATWYQLHLPAQALDFFAAVNRLNLRAIFMQWAKPCSERSFKDKKTNEVKPNSLFEQMCDDIEQRRSIAPLVRSILIRRDPSRRILTNKEKTVLQIYEDMALGKSRRFEILVLIAESINSMETRYRDFFVKRLANMRRKESLLNLMREYAHSDKTALRLTHEEIELLESERSNEIISLLYLLCVAEKKETENQ